MRCDFPDGFLFGTDGAKLALKEKLLRKFNLHTIIRLPGSIFSPYTSIATNILFFNNEAAFWHIKAVEPCLFGFESFFATLGCLIVKKQNIMRQDAGINGDAQRIEQMTVGLSRYLRKYLRMCDGRLHRQIRFHLRY